jgi:tetrahydromethanopterin S-methyltransferase subunit G
MSQMEREELKELIEAHIDRQVNKLLLWIIGMILCGVGSMIYTVISLTETTQKVVRLEELQPTVEDLKKWRIGYDATTRVTPEQAHALDKRLERMEDKLEAIMSRQATN